MSYLDVEDGKRIYYEYHRGRGRTTVLLIHAWAMSARLWDSLTPALLAEGHDVVALDQRSCGGSDKDFSDQSIDALGSDVTRLVRHLGLDSVVVNGWSLGGAVAVDAAAKLGTAAAGLVLTGAATPKFTSGDGWEYGNTPQEFASLLVAARESRPSFFAGISQAICHGEVAAELTDWFWQTFMRTSPRADESLRDLGAIDQRETAAGLSLPVLILHGRHDAFVAWDAAVAHSQILKNVRLVEFENSGHAPLIEESEKYRSELLDFLSELAKP